MNNVHFGDYSGPTPPDPTSALKKRRGIHWDYCIHMRRIYEKLGFVGGKIPKLYAERLEDFAVPIQTRYSSPLSGTEIPLTLIVKPATIGTHKSSKHRIFVECPQCGKEVPAGRLHQHIFAPTTCKPKEQNND